MVRWIFCITNGIALAINTSDIIYYRFTLRRTTFSIFSQFENESNLLVLIPKFLVDYWYGTLFFILLMWLFVRVVKRMKVEGPQLKNPWLFYSSGVLAIPIMVVLFIGGYIFRFYIG